MKEEEEEADSESRRKTTEKQERILRSPKTPPAVFGTDRLSLEMRSSSFIKTCSSL